MKLKNILIEAMSKKELTLDEAVDVFKKNNSSYTEYRKHIFRGSKTTFEDFVYVNPSASERYSAYTSNFYTILLSNLPSWSKYPKRNRSIICSTDKNNARSYAGGNTNACYYVFPKDGAKIGVCPASDIWWAFAYPNRYKSDMRGANNCFKELYDTYHQFAFDKKGDYSLTYPELLDMFEYITENPELFKYEINKRNYIFHEWDNNYRTMSFEKYIDSLFLNPKFNKFQLVTYGPKFPELGYNNEVWTDSECLLVSEYNIRKFKERVGLL